MSAVLSPAPAKTKMLVPVGIGIVTVLCWAYLVLLSTRMGDMGSPFAMPMTSAWTGSDVLLMSTMWAVMMAGMMLPSAAPMVSAYAKTVSPGQGRVQGSTALFTVGYIAAWSGFAALATGAQWVLHDLALVDGMGGSTSRLLGGLLLVGAGAYQFTGLKDACLSKCRTPLAFLLTNWRAGRGGAVAMGIHHGSLCVGCCWALMALLFVLGVMNLWWIAVVAAVAFLEKFVRGDSLTRVLGASLLVWGVVLLTGVA